MVVNWCQIERQVYYVFQAGVLQQTSQAITKCKLGTPRLCVGARIPKFPGWMLTFTLPVARLALFGGCLFASPSLCRLTDYQPCEWRPRSGDRGWPWRPWSSSGVVANKITSFLPNHNWLCHWTMLGHGQLQKRFGTYAPSVAHRTWWCPWVSAFPTATYKARFRTLERRLVSSIKPLFGPRLGC